jgi:alkylation response protein AidB-like acyl-CoA dehydrogenase
VAGEFGREARRGLDVEQDLALGRRYLAARFDAGFAGINWPTEMGGQGLTHIEKVIFDTEEIGMPTAYFGISLGMPVPILMRFCEDKAFVKERVLKALRGEEIWCQLFSEPVADRTSPACAPAPKWTATAGSSTGRRCGRAGRSIATMA